MIVVSNIHIPALDTLKPRDKKEQKPIAKTPVGDVAYYVTNTRGGRATYDLDDEDDDEMSDEPFYSGSGVSSYSKPQRSFTGADWQPVFNDRMTVFIAGVPGAGKSFLAKKLINLLPNNLNILLFTALDEKDGNFDDLGKERLFKIKMTPEVLGKINLAEIRARTQDKDHKQTILLFDDVDKIRDSKVQNATFAIMNDALANGRGHEKHNGDGDIHVICTSHSANDFIKTKYMFENSNYVALFPGVTPAMQLKRMFDKLGLDTILCQKMMRLGRKHPHFSILIHKTVPMYMLYGNQIMQL